MPRDEDLRSAAEHQLMQGFPPPVDKRVNRSNALSTSPFNRWAYLNMRALYPSTPVRCAAQPMAIPRQIDTSITNLKVAREDGSLVGFERHLEETYTDALLVIQGDQLVFEAYNNGMSADRTHQMMSCTKSFAGLLALTAVHEGRMAESDLVRDLVPELAASSGFADATLGQVLDMTNSLSFNEDYEDPEADIWHYTRIIGWSEEPLRDADPSCLHEYLTRLNMLPGRKHGDVFHYQSPKTDAVNWITNRVVGHSYEQGLSEKIWSQIGTEGDTYVLVDRIATLVAAGGLNATPNNLARFVMMLLANGRCQDKQVVPAAVIDKLRAGGSREAFSQGPEAKDMMSDGQWSYRGQWWVRHTPGREAFMALGIHGQWLYIDIAHQVGVVRLSSQPAAVDNYYEEFNLNGIDALIDHLSGR